MVKKIILFCFNIILLLSTILSLMFNYLGSINIILKYTLLILVLITFLLSNTFTLFNLNKLYKTSYVIFVLSCTCILIYSILYSLGIINTFSSVQSLKEYILSTKEKGIILYILIQCSQVIFMPIPAAIICVVGSLIYGPLLSGIYCSIGVLLGSYISFIIGKTFGYRIVSWIVGKDNTDKYSEILRKRGSFFLGIAFLLPMFPDDILCLIAGITKLKFSTFFWITLITRPIGVLCMSYFSSGSIIPFSGWGIYVWILIIVVALILTLLIYKYQDRMQNFVINKLFKNKKSK